jgi:hypothetical protein
MRAAHARSTATSPEEIERQVRVTRRRECNS